MRVVCFLLILSPHFLWRLYLKFWMLDVRGILVSLCDSGCSCTLKWIQADIWFTFPLWFSIPGYLLWTFFTPLSSCLSRCGDAFDINPIFPTFPFFEDERSLSPYQVHVPALTPFCCVIFFAFPYSIRIRRHRPSVLHQGRIFKTCLLPPLYLSYPYFCIYNSGTFDYLCQTFVLLSIEYWMLIWVVIWRVSVQIMRIVETTGQRAGTCAGSSDHGSSLGFLRFFESCLFVQLDNVVIT